MQLPHGISRFGVEGAKEIAKLAEGYLILLPETGRVESYQEGQVR